MLLFTMADINRLGGQEVLGILHHITKIRVRTLKVMGQWRTR